ncbi:MAG: transcription antitermination factor NusB [Clostridia bacterium]|nr:transcription antitermination factor NusB [Clostridia bacterium]
MTRRESREQAFALLFEKMFNDQPVEELAAAATEARETPVSAFAMTLAAGAEAHLGELDEKIAAYSVKWRKDRISRVAMSVMRLAVYEMLYEEGIPVSVSINEAVELAKKYGGDEDASFVNGILGSIARESSENV